MAKTNIFGETAKMSSSKTVGETIKNNPAMERATRENPQLAIAIAEAGRLVSSAEEIDESVLRRIIETDSELKLASKDGKFKKELADFFAAVKDDKVAVGGAKILVPGSSGGGRTDGNLSEIPSLAGISDANNQRLLALLDAIPEAFSGRIITDEHHNTLRAAVRFIASLLDDAEKREVFVLNFAPYLMPADFEKIRERNFQWEVIYNQASVPDNLPEGDDVTVAGAFAVQLPNEAAIRQITVRGEGELEQTRSPKSFEMMLFSQPLDDKRGSIKEIVKLNLTERRGDFRVSERISDNIEVDNAKFQYFVSAVWTGNDNTRQVQIDSIQIVCER